MHQNRIILEALEAFDILDGKDVAILKQIAKVHTFESSDIEYLLSIVETEDERFQIGASWLLCNIKKSGTLFNEEAARRLIDQLGDDRFHWQVHLHYLQLIESLPIMPTEYPQLPAMMSVLSTHENKFVRAWAMSAMIWLADLDTTLRPAVLERIEEASQESASIQARIRNRLKKCDW